jgi:hypothetical protein
MPDPLRPQGKKPAFIRPIAIAHRAFPGAMRAAGLALALSLLCWAGARLRFHDSRPLVFLLGDSNIGNYRLAKGQRLEDALQRMEPGTRVESWAEPGATPLDFFLQYCRGVLLAGRPKKVVIALEPSKFLDAYCPHRLDEGGTNLRWLPLSRSGLTLWSRLSSSERNMAFVELSGLAFFGIADAARYLWLDWVQFPWERNKMLTATEERRKRIEAKSTERGLKEKLLAMPDDQSLAALPLAQDGNFLLSALHADGVETTVMLMPFGNPALIRKTCPPEVIAKHDTLVALMNHWLERQPVEYVDFNSPVEMAHFPDPTWDDRDHVKDPAAIAYLAERVHRTWEQARPAGVSLADPALPPSGDGPRN